MSTDLAPTPSTATLRVQLVAATQFFPPVDVPWIPEGDGGQDLAEFAGRGCYGSWSRPNPATATNRGYIAHILDVGHGSVLEHASVSFYLTGVSRSLTHELVRHRHFSFSQLSQRFVNEAGAEFVVPGIILDDPDLLELFDQAASTAVHAYEDLVTALDAKLADSGLTGTARRKAARQAARSVLPNATETRLVVTGNYRAMRHFLAVRGSEHADVEIRALAVEIRQHLVRIAPNVFQDFEIVHGPDGLPTLVSPYPVAAP